MTLLAKITLAAALLLSIAIPFGAFAAGEKTKGRYKTALGINALLFVGTLVTAGTLMFTGNAFAAETASTASNAAGWGYLAAALSTGMRYCRICSSFRSSGRYQRGRFHSW